MNTNIRGSEWRIWDLHVHTASSYDAYKGDDSNELLCKAWEENNISAVAITDHFLIDAKRIQGLRDISKDVTIFPGVELRTDKGATNLHVILIFPETTDLVDLELAFKVIMLDKNAKNKGDNHLIYWEFNDILEFAKSYKGLISLHTGSKTQGMDDVITNAMPVNMAIKTEIASKVDFYEIGKTEDVETHIKHIFPHIGWKPLILCSDNHNPKEYKIKDKLWIKADLTFDGLLQVINHPQERVFIGEVPIKVDKSVKNKQSYIDSLRVSRVDSPRNSNSHYFDFEIPLNNGLTVVIGNKGSGKSAFADILGHLCESHSMTEASFLNRDRFGKRPLNLADDYIGKIKWLDGEETEEISLGREVQHKTVQNAQYLPQKFIERICTDLGSDFQKEINNVIFSYVDSTERAGATNFEELVEVKSKPYLTAMKTLEQELDDINSNIIRIEKKLTSHYKSSLEENHSKIEDVLKRHTVNKPVEVEKPQSSLSPEVEKQLTDIDEAIKQLEEKSENLRSELTNSNIKFNNLNNLKSEIVALEGKIINVNKQLNESSAEFGFTDGELEVKYTTPLSLIEEKLLLFNQYSIGLSCLLDESESADMAVSIIRQLKYAKNAKKEIVSKSDSKEKAYQKYLDDLKEWESVKTNLIGSAEQEGSLEFYKDELKKVNSEYGNKYETLKSNRISKVQEIFAQLKEISSVYSRIYEPVENELKILLEQMDDNIEFDVNIVLSKNEYAEKVLDNVNHSFKGVFSGKVEALSKVNEFIRETNFDDITSVSGFINKMFECVYENIDKSEQIVKDKRMFYNTVTNLNYLDVEYSLKLSNRSLQELSPGERGIVLLVFYLALNKEEKPLIIDQPEDNLDNESVFGKLVPCICAAKKNRQVIIVTHNPNIAVACDAEQVVHCTIDKTNNKIVYTSGSIENQQIRESIIDVLEGTKPAFDLRKRKYMFN